MRLVVWTGLWVFALDQLTKYLVVQRMGLIDIGSVRVWPGVLEFHMAWNRGVNFGLFAKFDMRWVLVALALVISGFVIWWVRKDKAASRWIRMGAGLLVGGALGNVVDRVIYGAVADFLNLSCCGIENPYAFNLADVAIFLGAVMMVLFTGETGGATGKRRGNKTP